jgi:hypothetical protein
MNPILHCYVEIAVRAVTVKVRANMRTVMDGARVMDTAKWMAMAEVPDTMFTHGSNTTKAMVCFMIFGSNVVMDSEHVDF